MKLISVAFIFLTASAAFAETPCGAPLADRNFCASTSTHTKYMKFKSNCTFSFWSADRTGRTHYFDGTWSLKGNLLTVASGGKITDRSITISEDGNSFSALGYPNEIYSVCR